MYKIPAKTLFTGQNLVFVPECHSTNVLALEMSQKRALPEGSVVITNNQSRGKGQLGNAWITEPGKNLTLSIVVRPNFLAIQDQFYLTMATSLALVDLLKGLAAEKAIHIKWPNDILMDRKKVCGILIENQLQGTSITQTIVGIGLNVNQSQFHLAQATSMKIVTGLEYDLNEVMASLCEKFEAWYLQLRDGRIDQIKQAYLANLFLHGQNSNFMDSTGLFNGTIMGVDAAGRLMVEKNGQVVYYNTKEIHHEF